MGFPSPKRFLVGMLGSIAVGIAVNGLFPLLGIARGQPGGNLLPLILGGVGGVAGWWGGQWVLDLIEARGR